MNNRHLSSELPQFKNWIDHLLDVRSIGSSTESIVQQMAQYAAIFGEIMRYTDLLSPQLTTVIAKVWDGVENLLKHTIKTYHRYVKRTKSIQSEAEKLVGERQRQSLIARMKEEESVLDQTFLRARVRNLQAEIDSLKTVSRGIEKENAALKEIVHTYIRSSKDDRRNATSLANAYQIYMNEIDLNMNSVLAGILKEEDRQRLLMDSLLKLIFEYPEICGRPTGKGNSNVGVISVAVQVNEVDSCGVGMVSILDNADKTVSDRQVRADIPLPTYIPDAVSVSVPYLMRKFFSTLPVIVRIPSAAWLKQAIAEIYLEKVRYDETNRSEKREILVVPLANYVVDYYRKKYGVFAFADTQLARLLAACTFHVSKVRGVSAFVDQIGLERPDEPPPLDARDTDFILSIIKSVMFQNAQSEAGTVSLIKPSAIGAGGAVASSKGHKGAKSASKVIERGSSDFLSASEIPTHISRDIAIAVVRDVIGKWQGDGGEQCVRKVNVMHGTSEKGTKFLTLDDLIDTLLPAWGALRKSWERHAHHLFLEHCATHRVAFEADFNSDSLLRGDHERDAVLVEIPKSEATRHSRRRIRFFERPLIYQGAGGDSDKEGDSAKKKLLSSTAQEAICETMQKPNFALAMKTVLPSISDEKIALMYEDACHTAFEETILSLGVLWRKSETPAIVVTDPPFLDEGTHGLLIEPSTQDVEGGVQTRNASENATRTLPQNFGTQKYFYVNLKSGSTQWTKPYDPKTFRSTIDIELNHFIDVILKHYILPSSPLREMMNSVSPEDLWKNAPLMLKKMQERQSLQAAANAAKRRMSSIDSIGPGRYGAVASTSTPQQIARRPMEGILELMDDSICSEAND